MHRLHHPLPDRREVCLRILWPPSVTTEYVHSERLFQTASQRIDPFRLIDAHAGLKPQLPYLLFGRGDLDQPGRGSELDRIARGDQYVSVLELICITQGGVEKPVPGVVACIFP